MLGTLARSPTGYAAGRSPDPQKPLEACPRSPPTRLNFPTPPTHVRVIKGRGARARGPWWLARAPRRVSMKNARCSGDRSGPRGRGSCSLYGVLTLCRVSSVVRYPWFYVAGRGLAVSGAPYQADPLWDSYPRNIGMRSEAPPYRSNPDLKGVTHRATRTCGPGFPRRDEASIVCLSSIQRMERWTLDSITTLHQASRVHHSRWREIVWERGELVSCFIPVSKPYLHPNVLPAGGGAFTVLEKKKKKKKKSAHVSVVE